ncbi:hypothetical protein D5085_03860 [Ectothiorhodospiraceae bacterium BW-2]|nr:hypothetical protein D5085_03860 [Ectothiorhodospiraceae bacterium BW-2]
MQLLPQSGIELNYFDGTDTSSGLLDYRSENCTVVPAIEKAIDFVSQANRTTVKFDSNSPQRIEQPSYEPMIIRELIVNAFMHRDWSIFGQRIRLNLFHDRLELFSPGKLPNTLNLTRALSGISYYRNPIISQMLKDYGLADRIGRGLQKVVNFHREHQLPPPLFEADIAFFRVTLYNANQ